MKTTSKNIAKVNIIVNQWELKVKTDNLFEARENVSEQVGIAFSFLFRYWFKLYGPITERSEAKNQSNPESTFQTQLITALPIILEIVGLETQQIFV